MAEKEETTGKEGENLLGSPTFTELDNGRFKCVETGHEVLDKDKESYTQSKKCRLGLIDHALSNRKPPLNMFKQDPLNRSKLVCKLTGDTVNKSEEHIWKHINGRRFLNKLDGKASEENGKKEDGDENEEEGEKKRKNKKKKKKQLQKKAKSVEEIVTEMRDTPPDGETDSEEADFWMPPVGDRWDFDEGDDRWGSDDEGIEAAPFFGVADDAVEDVSKESEDLSSRFVILSFCFVLRLQTAELIWMLL
ncbi:hypothetical protein LINPERHAP1_LOCUS171 [Linum perenne]